MRKIKSYRILCNITLMLTILSACSLKQGSSVQNDQLSPLWIRAENVNQGGNCERGWIKAKNYFGSKGIEILHSDSAAMCVVCLPGLLSPVVNGLAYSDRLAVVFSSPISSDQTAKYFVHEINHLLGKSHEWWGVMFPVTDLFWVMRE